MLRQTTGNNKALSLNFHFLLFTPPCTLSPVHHKSPVHHPFIIHHPFIPCPLPTTESPTLILIVFPFPLANTSIYKKHKNTKTSSYRSWSPSQMGTSPNSPEFALMPDRTNQKLFTQPYAYSNSQTLKLCIIHNWKMVKDAKKLNRTVSPYTPNKKKR